jgi:glycosyltransferase involved in cell wall biosynthesis
MSPKILIFIPTKNDHELIDDLTNQVLSQGENYSLLVIDDGSDIPIPFKADAIRKFLFRIPYNAGIGLATRIALNFFLKNNFNFFVRIDADGQHSVSDINKIINLMINENCDAVITERINNNQGRLVASFFKNFINWMGNFIFKTDIIDWHSGFVGLNIRAVDVLSRYKFERYPEVEIISLVIINRLKFRKINIIQNDRLYSCSSLTLFQGIRHTFKTLLVLIFLRIRNE